MNNCLNCNSSKVTLEKYIFGNDHTYSYRINCSSCRFVFGNMYDERRLVFTWNHLSKDFPKDHKYSQIDGLMVHRY